MADHDPTSYNHWVDFYDGGDFDVGRPLEKQDDGEYDYVGAVEVIERLAGEWRAAQLRVLYDDSEWVGGIALELSVRVSFTGEPERMYRPEATINLPWCKVRQLHELLGALLSLHAGRTS